MEIGTYGMLILLLFLPMLQALLWFLTNRKRLKDVWNYRFRRNRCVKVNLKTVSRGTIEKFIVPDQHGMMRVEGGIYKFDPEFATFNQRYRIPEIDIIENQIHPASPGIATVETEIDIEIPSPDGGPIQVKKEKVPTYILSYRRVAPQKLKDRWAKEVAEFADSHIVSDIATATSKHMQFVEWTFYLSIGSVLVSILGFMFLSNRINDVVDALQGLTNAILTQK